MKTTLTVEIEYDPKMTDPEGLACAMDRLLETALSTPGIFDEYPGRLPDGTLTFPYPKTPYVKPPKHAHHRDYTHLRRRGSRNGAFVLVGNRVSDQVVQYSWNVAAGRLVTVASLLTR
jgi:hypothetical protein